MAVHFLPVVAEGQLPAPQGHPQLRTDGEIGAERHHPKFAADHHAADGDIAPAVAARVQHTDPYTFSQPVHSDGGGGCPGVGNPSARENILPSVFTNARVLSGLPVLGYCYIWGFCAEYSVFPRIIAGVAWLQLAASHEQMKLVAVFFVLSALLAHFAIPFTFWTGPAGRARLQLAPSHETIPLAGSTCTSLPAGTLVTWMDAKKSLSLGTFALFAGYFHFAFPVAY